MKTTIINILMILMIAGLGSLINIRSAEAEILEDTFYPGNDTRITSAYPDFNDGDDTALSVQNTGVTVNSLLKWDLGELGNATIQDAVIHIYYQASGSSPCSACVVTVYKCARTDWLEMEATYIAYDDDGNWTTPGGDYYLSNPYPVSKIFSTYGWYTINITEMVQDAVDNEGGVVSVLLKMNPSASLSLSFRSNEYPVSAYRPYLAIEYGGPRGQIEAADNITSVSAEICGIVVDAGNYTSYGNASVGIYNMFYGTQEYTVEDIIDDQVVCHTFTGLVPDQTYSYYFQIETDEGNWYPSGNLPEFTTLGSEEVSAPLAETEIAEETVQSTTVDIVFNGVVVYDGNLDCTAGFQYKETGGNWTSVAAVEANDDLRTHDVFHAHVNGLDKGQSYTWRAFVSNNIGTGYGEEKTFVTSGIPMPTPTATPYNYGGVIPETWEDFFTEMGAGLKLLIALIFTIGGMILISTKTGRNKSSHIVVFAYGAACIVGFSYFSWYPPYVIILLAGVVGLLILFSVSRSGAH